MIMTINRPSALSIKEQIKGQISMLSGSGTFVKKRVAGLNRAGLKDILMDAMKKAAEQGYTQRQITDFFVTQLVSPPQPGKCRVLVVECNQETLDDIEGAIRKIFGVHTQGVLIQALEKKPETASLYLIDKDVVVCGYNHMTEFQYIFPDCTLDVIPVLFKTYVRLINELLKLPPNTKVAFSRVNQRSTEIFYKNLQFSEGRSLRKVYVSLDKLQELPEILGDCEVVFATSYVYDQIKDLLGDTKRLVKVDISIDPQSIELIREKIISLR